MSVIGIEKEKKRIIFRTNYFLNKAKNNSKTSVFSVFIKKVIVLNIICYFLDYFFVEPNQ